MSILRFLGLFFIAFFFISLLALKHFFTDEEDQGSRGSISSDPEEQYLYDSLPGDADDELSKGGEKKSVGRNVFRILEGHEEIVRDVASVADVSADDIKIIDFNTSDLVSASVGDVLDVPTLEGGGVSLFVTDVDAHGSGEVGTVSGHLYNYGEGYIFNFTYDLEGNVSGIFTSESENFRVRTLLGEVVLERVKGIPIEEYH